MNRKIKVLFIAVVIFALFSSFAALGFDGLAYTVDIPENYQKQNNDTTDIWVDMETSNTLNILVSPNTRGDNYKEATAEAVANLIPQMREQLESQSLSYGDDAGVEVKNVTNKLTMINGYEAIVWNIETAISIGDSEYPTYQNIYSFTSVNYVYTVTFTKHDNAAVDAAEQAVIDSFKINDELFVEVVEEEPALVIEPLKLIIIIAAAVIVAVIITVVVVLVKSNKR